RPIGRWTLAPMWRTRPETFGRRWWTWWRPAPPASRRHGPRAAGRCGARGMRSGVRHGTRSTTPGRSRIGWSNEAMTRILVGTDDGLRTFGADGTEGPLQHAGRDVTALGAEYPDVWAIVDGHEVWRSDGSGWSRRGILDGLRAKCIADTRAGHLVGTSEAHL